MSKNPRPKGAQVLAAIRRRAGLSQTKMALALKVKKYSYQRMEAGRTRLTAEVLWRARAVALELSGTASAAASLDRMVASGEPGL